MDFFLQQLANGIMMGSIYVLIAMGLVIILSMMDIVNFAHGQLAMLGAYITILIMKFMAPVSLFPSSSAFLPWA